MLELVPKKLEAYYGFIKLIKYIYINDLQVHFVLIFSNFHLSLILKFSQVSNSLATTQRATCTVQDSPHIKDEFGRFSRHVIALRIGRSLKDCYYVFMIITYHLY